MSAMNNVSAQVAEESINADWCVYLFRNASKNLFYSPDDNTFFSGKSCQDEQWASDIKVEEKLPSVITTNPEFIFGHSGVEENEPDTGFAWYRNYKNFLEESPFFIVDEHRGNVTKVIELISFIDKFVKVPFGSKLSKRIKTLFEYSCEDPEESEISAKSLQNFVAFLQASPNLKCPDVVLSPSGNIVSEWRADPNRHFSAEFLPGGDVRFVIFKPNNLNEEKPIRLVGLAPWESLLDTISPHSVFQWAQRE